MEGVKANLEPKKKKKSNLNLSLVMECGQGRDFIRSQLEMSRLSNRDISLTPLIATSMEKVSWGGYWQMLLSVWTGSPREKMPLGAWNHEREKGTEPGKQILSHVCVENNGLKPQSEVILPGRKYKEKNRTNCEPVPSPRHWPIPKLTLSSMGEPAKSSNGKPGI